MSAITAIYMTERQASAMDQGNGIMSALSKFPCDAAQAWHKEHVFLGCRNQWITPEARGECNPYYDAERQLVIAADAIIDNRSELFQWLQVPDVRRERITDTELILLAYAKWGEDSPKRLIGDFAFAIWDEREERLFAARDMTGSRTLYYSWNGSRLALCTTMNPLTVLPDFEKRLNEQWLAQYLAISTAILTVDAASNVYKDIWQLPPSHSMTVAGDQLKVSRYYTIKAGAKLRFKSDDQYIEAFQEVFQEAVNARLRTHRQIGSHLSGGLDSGAVVAFAAQALRPMNKQLHTFSYIPVNDFTDYTPKYRMADESAYIESTVRHVGGIRANYLNFENKNSYSDIAPCLDTLEMPYKNFVNSFWIKGIFEKASEQDVGVLLTGARGNMTISWGDALRGYLYLFKRLKWARLLHELQAYSVNMRTGRGHLLSIMMKRALHEWNLKKIPASDAPRSIIRAEFARKTNVTEQLRMHGMNEHGIFITADDYEFRRRHFEDPFHWNSTNMLNAKLSLTSGLWSRDPSNDIRVIQFCLAVPEDQYVHNGLDRALIRRATDRLLPDQIRLNQHVRGVQGADWLHRMQPDWHRFIEEAEQMSKDDRMMEFVDGRLINDALSRYKQAVQPELAYDDGLRTLMWSLIVYRFLKRNL